MHTVSMRPPWFVADERNGPGMHLRLIQEHRVVEQTRGCPPAHLPHHLNRSRGTRGRGLFLGIGVSVRRTNLVQVLLDAVQDRKREAVHRLRVPSSRGGAFGLPVFPADGLGKLDTFAA